MGLLLRDGRWYLPALCCPDSVPAQPLVSVILTAPEDRQPLHYPTPGLEATSVPTGQVVHSEQPTSSTIRSDSADKGGERL